MEDDNVVWVITRTGKKEVIDPNQITKRILTIIKKEPKIDHINPYELMVKITGGLKSNITTYEIDEYVGNAAASMSLSNPYCLKLAGRIIVDNHQKNTDRSFVDKMRKAYLHEVDGRISPLLSSEFYKYVEEHGDVLESYIDYSRDFLLDFFGMRTFQRLYGMKINGKTIERPQDLFMRTAVALHMNHSHLENDLKLIKETYDALSNKLYTQATPTYFNAGSPRPQFASCFLLGSEDSIEGIMHSISNSAYISKLGGGIGFNASDYRAAGSLIRGTNGQSSGIAPFIQILDKTMLAFNQGGKRNGSAAVYLMPHHPDILIFLELKSHDGRAEDRARSLFYAVWLPDIFMERAKNNQLWSLFNPTVCNLADYHGVEYTEKYLSMEKQKLYCEQIPARVILDAIYKSNKQTGVPYICFADAANRSSMQNNIGIIKISNLCTEIYLHSSSREYAVCNLASISLTACVVDANSIDNEFPTNPRFDFDLLRTLVKLAVININNIIDKTYYPVVETERSNVRHRPIGIGIQGLADAFLKMRYAFDSPAAALLNKQIAETMYYAALSQSTQMCRESYLAAQETIKEKGFIDFTLYTGDSVSQIQLTTLKKTQFAYPSYEWNGGSHLSHGKFHWELCGATVSDMYDWESLRAHIKIYGVRNSVLLALMPTASTSQLLGNNECFEPYTSNIYTRKTLAGDFLVINKYLIHDLHKLNLWTPSMIEYLKATEGSIQVIDGIPDELKNLYKTAWEIDQSVLIQYAIDRQPFIDQGQSLNWYVEDITQATFNKLLFQAWRGGLKTAKYYTHMRPSVSAHKFSIDANLQKEVLAKLELEKNKRTEQVIQHDVCDLCSS